MNECPSPTTVIRRPEPRVEHHLEALRLHFDDPARKPVAPVVALGIPVVLEAGLSMYPHRPYVFTCHNRLGECWGLKL